MEHESFENEAIAQTDERELCVHKGRSRRASRSGLDLYERGSDDDRPWRLAMTMFLTPDLKPFYGGTYYPPEDRRGMAGFPRVLTAIVDSYKNRREEILSSADAITNELKKGDRFASSNELLTTEVLNSAFLALRGTSIISTVDLAARRSFPRR
jgi:hypothetical protein